MYSTTIPVSAYWHSGTIHTSTKQQATQSGLLDEVNKYREVNDKKKRKFSTGNKMYVVSPVNTQFEHHDVLEEFGFSSDVISLIRIFESDLIFDQHKK